MDKYTRQPTRIGSNLRVYTNKLMDNTPSMFIAEDKTQLVANMHITIIPVATTEARNIKLGNVRAFIDAHRNLAPQGSEEWLKTRQSIVGGSELSILIGKNPFSSIADLVASKCGLSKFTNNVATKWGNIFEELTRIITQLIFIPDIPLSEECIYETGSLEGIIPHHRFSPDGLTVIICKKANGDLVPIIVLLEFKSPLSSIPAGVVPPYYLPQVKAGLCDIEMTEMGLFINNMYRKCTLAQFGNNPEYNRNFHGSDIKKKVTIQEPFAIGILGLYQTEEQHARLLDTYDAENSYTMRSNDDSSSDEDTREDITRTILHRILHQFSTKGLNKDNTVGRLIDVGALDEQDTLKLFQYICNKQITVKYFAPNIYMHRLRKNIPSELICADRNIISYSGYETNPAKFVRKFVAGCIDKGYRPVGFLPWKLFKSDMILVDKDPMYIYQFVPKINEVITIVSDICATDHYAERQARFERYFPHH
jgi:hypothetical protein